MNIALYTDMMPFPSMANWSTDNVGAFVDAVVNISNSCGRSNVYIDAQRSAMLYNARSGTFIIPQKEGLPRVY